MNNDIIKLENINKIYKTKAEEIHILKDVNLSFKKGEFASIQGKSGSGKTTLLNILGLLDQPTNGIIKIDGEEISQKNEKIKNKIRNEKIGFVFQFHYLLAEYNVLKNVMLPGMKLAKYSDQELEHRAMEHLKTLDMEDQALKMPNQLSGGQKQRVAIARALINDPLIIMGDEPTGNLDRKNSDLVFDIFNRLTQEQNQTLLVVTHDTDFAERTNRIITMEDGKIIS